jgi:hypothetical protein
MTAHGAPAIAAFAAVLAAWGFSRFARDKDPGGSLMAGYAFLEFTAILQAGVEAVRAIGGSSFDAPVAHAAYLVVSVVVLPLVGFRLPEVPTRRDGIPLAAAALVVGVLVLLVQATA